MDSIVLHFVITNNDYNVLIFNIPTATIVNVIANLTFHQPYSWPRLPSIVKGYKEDVLYINTRTSDSTSAGRRPVRVSIQNGSISSQFIVRESELYVAVGNHDQGDLYMLNNLPEYTITVMDANTAKIIYSRDSYSDDFIMTNTTYTTLTYSYFQVFNLSNDALIGDAIWYAPSATTYFFDKEAEQVYFFNSSYTNGSIALNVLDLKTGHSHKLDFVPSGVVGNIIQARTPKSGNPWPNHRNA